MGLYDRIKDVCNARNTSINKLEKKLEFPRSSMCKYNTNSPSIDKIDKIANELDVTVDFLMGKTDTIECEECGQKYNPLDEFDCAIHDQFHNKIIEAQKMYDFLVPYRDIANVINRSKADLFKDDADRLEALQSYLKASFSSYVYRNFEHGKEFDYEDFCKTEAVKMIEDGDIPADYVNYVIDIFKLDPAFINNAEQLIAKVRKSEQLMRIMEYTASMKPELLDSIEIQLKALSEKDRG